MDVVKKTKQWWESNDGTAVLLGTAVTAFVTYFYYLTLEPMNSDTFCEGLLQYSVYNSDVSLGRWMTPYCAMLTGGIVSPILYLAIYFFCNAVFSVFLIDVWRIKGRLFRVLTGMIITVTPAIVGQTLYIYEMMTYIVSLVCIVISLRMLLLNRNIASLFVGSIIFAVALGAFQANIAVVIVVIIGYMLTRIVANDEIVIRDFCFEVVRYVVFGIIGIAMYWILMLVHLKMYGLSRPKYAGADKIGVLNSMLNMLHHIRRPYRLFIEYYKETSQFGIYLWEILFIVTICYIVYLSFQMWSKRKYWRIAAILVLLFLLPVGAEIMDIIAPEHGIQLYWMYQMQLMAPLCAAVITNITGREEPQKDDNNYKTILTRSGVFAASVCIIGMIAVYSLCAYSSFRTLDIGGRHIKLYVQNAVTHAIEDKEYKEGMPIVFMGFVDDEPVQEKNPLRKYSYYERAYPFWRDQYEVFSVWPKYCWYYFGIDIGEVTHEQYENILANNEFKAMEQYPSSKAYAVIDGCYVILLDKESVQ